MGVVMANKVAILHQRLEEAGIPIHGLNMKGIIHFKDEATTEQREAAAAIVAAYRDEDETNAENALKSRIRTLAQSAVGVQIDALTNVQVRALVAILLWKAGAVDNTGTIRPLKDWVRNGDS